MGAAPDSAERNESSGSNSPECERGSRWAELVLTNLLTALVVDGVTVCRLIAFHLLESIGVETMMVGSGQEALELSGTHYDLILVDRYMHDMDGLETIRRMRQRGMRSKIIGLTSGEIETDRVQMMNAGADDCLERPLRADALADILAEIDYEIDRR
ncbi:two-component response regulator ARR22-like [Rhodamnia argentea]|uniref:Two-component response regulator ARR22-like n=1 Tax=Rhodamnia argentea TaxID=178133 RepID=A0A8B8NM29_9MYRT|nr:two-component response regulator ARR22-like [Rhodamnia argentea]